MQSYDPELQPKAEEWLVLDEQERLYLVEEFHSKARIKLPNLTMHAAFHAIVENQLAEGLASVTRAIARLSTQGLSRHDAIHAVGTVLGEHLHERMNDKDTPQVAQARYDAAVERLTASEWYARYGA